MKMNRILAAEVIEMMSQKKMLKKLQYNAGQGCRASAAQEETFSLSRDLQLSDLASVFEQPHPKTFGINLWLVIAKTKTTSECFH